jgi:hypothetical protein
MKQMVRMASTVQEELTKHLQNFTFIIMYVICICLVSFTERFFKVFSLWSGTFPQYIPEAGAREAGIVGPLRFCA